MLNRRGFTLLEIVIATLLIATVGAVLLAAFANLQRYNVTSTGGDPSSYLVSERIQTLYESARADWWGYPLIATEPNRGPLSVGSYDDGTITLNGINYHRTYTVLPLLGPLIEERYRKVRVTVTWTT